MQKRHVIILLGTLILLSGIVFAQSLILKTESGNGLSDPYLYISLGDFLMEKGFSGHAVAAYEKALELEPDNKVVLNHLGYFFRETDMTKSEEYFRRAIESDNTYENARNNLAVLYNKEQKYSLAADQLKYLVLVAPENIKYRYDLAVNLAGVYYYETKDYDTLLEALDYFSQVYGENPDFEHVSENIDVLEQIKDLYD